MKLLKINTLFIGFLWLFSLPLQAQSVDDVDITQAIEARSELIQTEIEQLERAISLMSELMSNREQYENIALKNFAQSDELLKMHGFTLRRLLAFEASNKDDINKWLEAHPQQTSELKSLQLSLDNLLSQFDQVNTSNPVKE